MSVKRFQDLLYNAILIIYRGLYWMNKICAFIKLVWLRLFKDMEFSILITTKSSTMNLIVDWDNNFSD